MRSKRSHSRYCHWPLWLRVATTALFVSSEPGRVALAEESSNSTAYVNGQATVECAIPDSTYVDYVLGLKDRTFLFLNSYRTLSENERAGSQSPVPKPVLAAFRRKLMGDGTHPLDRLWVSLCEIEGYRAWLERARAQFLVNGSIELSDDAGFLMDLVNAVVMLLRIELLRLEACQNFQTPTVSTVIGDTAPPDQPEETTPRSSPRDVDRSQSCATQLKLRVPQGRQTHPRRLASILGGMMAAIARLDFVLKQFFTN